MKITAINQVENYERYPSSIPENVGVFSLLPLLSGHMMNFEGWVVTFDNGDRLEILIDNYQQCCEYFGSISLQDNRDEFIGADFLGFKVITSEDTGFNTVTMLPDVGFYEGEASFVQLETSNGMLEFAVYNDHNGYYGHTIITELVKSNVQ